MTGLGTKVWLWFVCFHFGTTEKSNISNIDFVEILIIIIYPALKEEGDQKKS